jgi:predicted negative regulator of RcsB-dependent stress response
VAYETDEQQAEALKKWWRENGRQVIFGAIIGLAAVFGWRAWQSHLGQVNAIASDSLERMMQISAQDKMDQALSQGQKIIDEYAKTVYADFASLNMAALLVQQGDEKAALAHLQRVVERDPEAALSDVARLRLVRLLIGQQRAAEAGALLDAVGPAYQSEVESLRGDIALASGDRQAARQAYQRALATGSADGDMLQLKLDDLPSGKPN